VDVAEEAISGQGRLVDCRSLGGISPHPAQRRVELRQQIKHYCAANLQPFMVLVRVNFFTRKGILRAAALLPSSVTLSSISPTAILAIMTRG
jgi:hypothetical protein